MAKSKTKKKSSRKRAKATKKKKPNVAKKPGKKTTSKAVKKKKTAGRTSKTEKKTPKAGKKPVSVRKKRPVPAPTVEEPLSLIPVPLPEGVLAPRTGETNERSAHLDKLKQLFDAAPISRYLGMALGYCENGVARVRLPFRRDFEEGHGVIHGGLIGLLADTAGNFAVGSVSPGSTVKTVEFKLSLLTGVQGDLLAIGEVVRKGRTLATCRLEVVEGNDRVIAIGLATYALQAV